MIRFKNLLLFVVFLHFFSTSHAQVKKSNTSATSPAQPKLVVGLVVDQMRWDYLYKFSSLYGNNGFKRLLQQGYTCENTMITHIPTYTAVGHTGIFTGSLPAIHGIVGNNWYDKASKKSVYCTDDSTVNGVGSDNEQGKMSPRNMLVNSVTDELRLSNNFQSKVIGISLKDRGAILPAGYSANAAYWFDDKEGKWISSSYYLTSLPSWVDAFNQLKQPDAFMSKDWSTLFSASKYELSTSDDMPFEAGIPGEKTTSFPHHLGNIKEKKYAAFKYTPFGNTFTLNFAKAAINNEQLGKNTVTDFLTLSLSSTDYIGHAFGPNSVEIEDTYIRLDNDIASFLQFLDSSYGKNNYLLFLSADHGVAHNASFLNSHNESAGTFSTKDLIKEINDSIYKQFNLANVVEKMENSQLYLNPDVFNEGEYNSLVINKTIISIINKKSFVSQAFDIKLIQQALIPVYIKSMSLNSFFQARSGDIQIIPKAGFYDGGKTGTTHGVWNPYDAHIPLVWFGWKIAPGKTHREVHMSDIAPTISALLNIQMPNGSVGKVITEIIP